MTEQQDKVVQDDHKKIPQWVFTAIVSLSVAALSWSVTTLNTLENNIKVLLEKVDDLEEASAGAEAKFITKDSVRKEIESIEKQLDEMSENVRYLYISRQDLFNRMFVPQKTDPPKN